jgi:protein TonB
MNIFVRWIPGTLIAAFVTFALFVLMMVLIKGEFKPQTKAEKLSFEINPNVEDIKLTVREAKIQQVRKVKTPPPPPMIERQQASQPTVKLVSVDGAIPDFEIPRLDKTTFQITVSDREAQPLVRIPPVMPPRFTQGDHSGHCLVRFDVSPEGSPFNVDTYYCTSGMLERATKKSVLRWKFQPKIVNGRPTSMRGVENRVTFELRDERGNILPEPNR